MEGLSKKIYVGDIEHNSKSFKVFWEHITRFVWVQEEGNSNQRNYGDITADNKEQAIEKAKEMVSRSGF